MICEAEKTQMPLPLVDAGASLDQQPKLPRQRRTLLTPEAKREYHRQWSQQHRERCREYSRKDYQKRYTQIRSVRGTEEYKAKLREYVRKHRAKHPELHKAALKRYREKHPEWFAEYRKNHAPRRRELYQMRKVELNAASAAKQRTRPYRDKANARNRKRRREDVQFGLADVLRVTMNRAFRRNWIKKPARTEALLGCTIAEAKAHIEAQFVNGMSWANRRSFVVDHIIPVASFDLRDAEEVQWAFNWRNLQPLTPTQNAHKSDTLPDPLPAWLPSHIAERIFSRGRRARLLD